MKLLKSLLLLAVVGLLTINTATAQLNLPAYSPQAEFKQDFALTTLEIAYGRPGAKNRKVFGSIVPFGDIWRVGANDPTTFHITSDITVNGEKLPKGKYNILTVPGEKEWQVIFNSNPETSYTNYVKEDNVLVVKVSPSTTKEFVETFFISTSDIKDNAMKLHLEWENTRITLQLINEVDGTIKKEFEQKLAGPNASDYFGMARYLYNSGGDMNKALEYIDISVEKNLGYGNLRYKGLILGRIGRDAEAIDFLTKSRDRAATYDNADYIRINNLSVEGIKAKKKN